MLNLNIDTSSVNTDFPSLEVGDVRARIVGHEVIEGKDNWKGLITKLVTINPQTDTNGKTIPPGFAFRNSLTLVQYDNGPDLAQSLARYLEAVHGPGGKARGFNDESVAASVGNEVIAVIKKAKEDRQEFGATECKYLKAVK